MKDEVDALFAALSREGAEGARKQMGAVLEAIRAPLDATQTRRLLDELRSQRSFAPMKRAAAAAVKVAEGAPLVYVRRQLAQAMIELGDLGDAIALLQGLIKDLGSGGTPKDRSEAFGLLGRALKQRFVDAVKGGDKGEDELRASVDAYTKGFEVGYDPGWHGANLVALAARAERDGFSAGTDSAETWANSVIARLEENERVRWAPWDYASAGEASLALGDKARIAEHFACYWNLSNADGFALAGTERQLREIWEFTNEGPDPLRSSLVVHLAARKLTAAKGAASYSPADLVGLAAQLRTASERAEATFGAGSSIPLDRLQSLMKNAASVCRITDVDNSGKAGTGFLVRGSDLVPPREGVCVLTNHHVLHGSEAPEDLLATKDYEGSINCTRAQAEFHFWNQKAEKKTFRLDGVLRHSCRSESDFTVASLTDALPVDLALTLSKDPKPLGSRNFTSQQQRPKVIVIGHPNGGDLRFSMSDNEVVDHELDDNPYAGPRRIHYRTPTEPGSSGSPVFHQVTLEIVGLHRTGRAEPLRNPWPRTKPDDVYEANEAVAVRSLLGL